MSSSIVSSLDEMRVIFETRCGRWFVGEWGAMREIIKLYIIFRILARRRRRPRQDRGASEHSAQPISWCSVMYLGWLLGEWCGSRFVEWTGDCKLMREIMSRSSGAITIIGRSELRQNLWPPLQQVLHNLINCFSDLNLIICEFCKGKLRCWLMRLVIPFAS